MSNRDLFLTFSAAFLTGALVAVLAFFGSVAIARSGFDSDVFDAFVRYDCLRGSRLEASVVRVVDARTGDVLDRAIFETPGR